MSAYAASFSFDFTYAGEKTPALSAVSGDIPPGTCIVLCGRSGCGKSTLLRCLNHLIPQFYEGNLQGFCRLDGEDLTDASVGETGKRAASVFQDPRSQFFTLNSDTEIAFGLENAGCSQEEIHARVDTAFRSFHLERLRDRNVFSLSSGERQLTALLAAWAMDTGILLLDEPTANLDDAAVGQLADTLRQLKARGKTLLISEHRLWYLRDIADEFWMMEDGHIRERLDAAEMKRLSEEERQNRGLRTLYPEQLPGRLLPPPVPVRNDTLHAENLHFRYARTSPEILHGISFEAHTGEVVGLLGANGCGKTTCGKLIAGLYKPTAGTISLNGQPLSGRALSEQSIFIMQEAEFQFFTPSVEAELAYGLPHPEEKKEEMEELLRMTGLWAYRHRHPFSLSGGQMQKLVLLLACLSSKPIVLLDEPTAGLDYASLLVCADLIRRMQKDRIVLLISHDLELLSLVCTRAVCLSGGDIRKTYTLQPDGKTDTPAAEQAFAQLRTERLRYAHEQPAPAIPSPKKSPRLLDPRTKLLFLLVSMLAGIFTDLALLTSVLLAVVLAALYERKGKLVLAIAGSMALILGLYGCWPTVATSFIAHFFPRIILMGAGAALVLAPDESPRMLAGFRALHLPEKVTMILSVVFRFFPVLHADLSLLSQSLRTRGFFRTFAEKLRAAPAYLEILLVPMVFRVLRIADTLSASAETRGISLPGRRSSYAVLHWTAADTCMIVLLAASAVTGLFII